ncbi:MAG: DUF2807 domain-containing protein [Bacteroidetes bacterium]|nr:DUF2807 domain-containing protein [Bacteroidota bacterium]
MKSPMFLFLVLFYTSAAGKPLGTTDSLSVKEFDKVMVSNRINAVLIHGAKPAVKLVCTNVSPDKVNVIVSNGTLKIYLEHARWTEKNQYLDDDGYDHSVPMYRGVTVTAYITYTELNEIEIRGHQTVSFEGGLKTDELKVKSYGEADITIPSLNADKMEVVLYGTNHLEIDGGKVTSQKFRLMGTNEVEASKLSAEEVTSTIYGDSKLRVNASSELSLTAIGEPTVVWSGTAHLHRGLILGQPTIRTTGK